MALNNIGRYFEYKSNDVSAVQKLLADLYQKPPEIPGILQCSFQTGFKGGQHHGDHGYHTGWRKD